jgi:hypothetical protein
MSLHNIIMAAAGSEPDIGPLKTFASFNGANNSTSFPDLKAQNTWSAVGSGAVISTTTPKYGTGSLRIPTTGWLINGSPQKYMDGQFTFECWFKNVSSAANHFIWCPTGTSYGGWTGGFVVSPALGFGWAGGVTGYTNIGGYKTNIFPTVNSWVHLACTRDASNTWRFFVGGVLRTHTRIASEWSGFDWGVSVTDQPAQSGWNIGHVGDGGYSPPGDGPTTTGSSNFWLDDLKIVKGQCNYTANFTPTRAAEST